MHDTYVCVMLSVNPFRQCSKTLEENVGFQMVRNSILHLPLLYLRIRNQSIFTFLKSKKKNIRGDTQILTNE